MTRHPYARGEALPSGETVTPARYRCRGCGEVLEVEAVRNLPVCPVCQGQHWDVEKSVADRVRSSLRP